MIAATIDRLGLDPVELLGAIKASGESAKGRDND